MKKKIWILIMIAIMFLFTGCEKESNSENIEDSSLHHYSARELVFDLPSSFNSIPSDKVGVYRFAMGKDESIQMVIYTSSLEEEIDLDSYAHDKPELSGTISKKEFHGNEWYVFINNHDAYYISQYNRYLYEIEFHNQDEKNETFEDVIMMFEKSLSFEVMDEK